MASEPQIDDPLELSRPVPPDVRLDRIGLELPDGYGTTAHVYTCQAAGAGDPVVYLHGIQSHPGWFSRSAAHLAASGHAALMPTRRGSGTNTVARGDARSAEQLLDDVAACCRLAMARFDAPRVHLVGVSWGGKLGAAFCLRRWEGVEIASLTMVAPGIAAKVDVPLSKKLAIGLALLGRPGTMFDIPLSDVSLFTDNPAMREYLVADAHRLHRATGRFLFASRRLDAMLKAPAGSLSVPTTLLLADRDRIIDNERTRQIVTDLTAGKVDVDELQAAHTMEFEESPEALHAALLAGVRADFFRKDAGIEEERQADG